MTTNPEGRGDADPNKSRRLTRLELESQLRRLHPDWTLNGQGTEVRRVFRFLGRNNDMMTFVMRIMDLASQEGLTPEVEVGWGQCAVRFSSSRRGLTEREFRGAARVDALKRKMVSSVASGTCDSMRPS